MFLIWRRWQWAAVLGRCESGIDSWELLLRWAVFFGFERVLVIVVWQFSAVKNRSVKMVG
jgi:hypothetical protein